MKNLIAFMPPFITALAGLITLSKPESVNEWAYALIAACAAGFAGNGARAINGQVGKKTK